jgi:Protein of unknown function (DUF2778)
MTRGAAIADPSFWRRGSLSTIVFFGATIVAWQVATWVADICSAAPDPRPENQSIAFDQRFPEDLPTSPPPSFVRALRSETAMKLQAAKSALAQKLLLAEGEAQMLLAESPPQMLLAEIPPQKPIAESEPAPSEGKPATIAISLAVPVPRPRPAEAALVPKNGETAQADDRTLLQKLAELLRPRITLASLTPGDGLSGNKLNLASLGYDEFTAVYDISARTIYMPNGSKLEAHSGLGSLKDDPRHVNEHGAGATPPAVYALKLRESLFHGVQALRMTPVGRNATLFGRSGLLAHSYMLGPDGDSNGCVSIRDYDRFLNAFQNGEVKQLLVVASLPDSAQQPPLKS